MSLEEGTTRAGQGDGTGRELLKVTSNSLASTTAKHQGIH